MATPFVTLSPRQNDMNWIPCACALQACSELNLSTYTSRAGGSAGTCQPIEWSPQWRLDANPSESFEAMTRRRLGCKEKAIPAIGLRAWDETTICRAHVGATNFSCRSAEPARFSADRCITERVAVLRAIIMAQA